MGTVIPPTDVPSTPSLTAVYEAFQRQLLEYVAAAGDPLPSFAVGTKATFDMHQGAPQIVWQPMGGKVGATASDYFDNPRALWSRDFVTVAWLWAVDIDAADALANHLVAAIDAVVHGSYKVLSEAWGDEDIGQMVSIRFLVETPFIDNITTSVDFVRALLDSRLAA